MFTISSLKKNDYVITIKESESLFQHELFNKHKLVSLNSENKEDIKDFFNLFFIPISKNGIDKEKIFDIKKVSFGKNKKDLNYTEYKLNLNKLEEYKNSVLSLFNEYKDSLCNNITSLGYKYFDAHANIRGNEEFETDLPYQDFDLARNVKILKLFFIIRQFYFDGKKTSIYQEIKKYKKNEEYSKVIKEIFESSFFSYDELNVNKNIYSMPRACIYLNVNDNEYKTIKPTITISQLLKFDSIFTKLNKYKYQNSYLKIGGTQPQNIGFYANVFSGSIKYFENKLFINENNNSDSKIYNLKFRLIPNNVFSNFNERKTYKKINHLNIITANSKTDKHLMNELNLILDDLLELIFVGIDDIQNENEDKYDVQCCDNYKKIKDFVLDNKNIEPLMEKIKDEVFQNLKLTKKVKFYDKRVAFFSNLFNLVKQRILNYV